MSLFEFQINSTLFKNIEFLKNKNMIIIKLKGGIGNQMFQYAFGRRIALENDIKLKFDITNFKDDRVYRNKYNLGCFNVVGNIAIEKDLRKARIFTSKSYFGKFIRLLYRIKPYYNRYIINEKKFFLYDQKVMIKKKNGYYNGYWQNEKYFKNIEDIIRQEFSFKNVLNHDNLIISEKIINSNSIAVHIRNYGKTYDEKASKRDLKNFGIMKMSYYQNALQYLENKINNFKIFIFSDDINWVKNKFDFKFDNIFYVDNEGKDYEQLQLMSFCKHQIISNSTFSWWAAWLNNNPDKVVIAPKNWFPNADTDTSELIPKEWLKI